MRELETVAVQQVSAALESPKKSSPSAIFYSTAAIQSREAAKEDLAWRKQSPVSALFPASLCDAHVIDDARPLPFFKKRDLSEKTMT